MAEKKRKKKKKKEKKMNVDNSIKHLLRGSLMKKLTKRMARTKSWRGKKKIVAEKKNCGGKKK